MHNASATLTRDYMSICRDATLVYALWNEWNGNVTIVEQYEKQTLNI